MDIEEYSLSTEIIQNAIESIRENERDRYDAITFQTNTSDTSAFGEPRITPDNQRIIQPFHKRKTLNKSKMPQNETNSIQSWFIDIAYNELFPESELAALFHDGGYEAIRHAVLEETSNAINDAAENDSNIGGFNQATMEWPHIARAYIAAYEARFSENGDEEYTRKCREFAEAENVFDYETEPEQTPLTMWGSDIQDNWDNYSTEKQHAIILLAANDKDIDVISSLPDIGNFVAWYKEYGDVDEAKRASHYDSSLPNALPRLLAEPADWPSDMDASNIEMKSCEVCSNQFYHVYHHEDGETHLNHNGDQVEIHNSENAYEIISEHTSQAFVCNDCVASLVSNNETAFVHDGNVFKIFSGTQVLYDYGGLDNDFTPVSEAPSHILERAKQINRRSITDEMMTIQPSSQAEAAIAEQHQSLQNIKNGNVIPDFDGEFYISTVSGFDETEFHVHAPRSEPQAVYAAKDFLNNAHEYAE